MFNFTQHRLPRRNKRTHLKDRFKYRPFLEFLEDRVVPDVTFSFDDTTLIVNLSDAEDHAFISHDGTNIRVGTAEGGDDVYDGGDTITSIEVQNTGGATADNQTVTFSGNLTITATDGSALDSVTVIGIETAEVFQLISVVAISGDVETVNIQTPGLIQHGIDLADDGATVNVAAGTYNEQIVIDKSLSLLGANAGIAAADGTGTIPETRVAESVISLEVNNLITIAAGVDDVTIDGFTLEQSSDTESWGLLNITGAQSDIRIANNIFTGIMAGTGNNATYIRLQTTSGQTRENIEIENNRFEGQRHVHIRFFGGGDFDGLHIAGNDFIGSEADFSAEAFSAFQAGYSNTGIFLSAGNGIVHDLNLEDNWFEGFRTGMNFARLDDPTIANNHITDILYAGIQVGTQGGLIASNTLTNFHGFDWGGTFGTLAYGINLFGPATTGDAAFDSGGVTITHNDISDFPLTQTDPGRVAGIYLPTGVGENVSILNNRIDSVANAVYIITDSTGIVIFDNSFTNNSLNDVINEGTATVNASGNWWGTTDPTEVQVSGLVDFTPMLASGTDTEPDEIGFEGDFSVLIVHTEGVQVGPDGRITEGVVLVDEGGTVNVLAGPYTEDVIVNKSVTLEGANAGINAGVGGFFRLPETVVDGGFRIQASDVTIDGFTVLNGVGPTGIGNTTAIWVADNSTDATIQNNIITGNNVGAGILSAFGSTNDNLLIQNNAISQWNNGIYNQSNVNVTILENRLFDNFAGISNDFVSDVLVQNNMIFDNVEGIGVLDVSNYNVHFNNFLRNSAAALQVYDGSSVNATFNWWNSPTGPQHAANPGGTGDAIVEDVFGTVDYVPFLNHVAIPFEDLFRQDPGDPLSPAWSQQQGSFNIIGEQMVAATPGISVATLINLNLLDVAVEADIDLTAHLDVAAFVARYSAGGNNMYWAGITIRNGTPFAEIWRSVNGVWTLLDINAVASATGRMRLEVSGQSVQLFLDDVRIASAVDNTITAPGHVGVWASQGVALDNFFVDLQPLHVVDLPFTDTFTQASGTPLSQDWITLAGSFVVQNNQLVANTAGANVAVLQGVSETNALVQTDFQLVNTGWVSVTARHSMDDMNQYWAGVIHQGGVTRAEIWLKLNGSWTQLASTTVGAITQGQLRFEVVNNSLKLFINNSLILFTFNNALTAPGSMGIWGSNFNRFDNFHADSIVLEQATLPHSENFNQPDGTQLSRFWRELQGNFTVVNNELRAFPTGVSAAILNGVNELNVQVEANFAFTNINSLGLTARHSVDNLNQYWGGVVYDGTTTRAEIWRRVGGGWTLLSSVNIGAVTTGHLRFEAVGTSLRLYINNNLTVLAFDNAITTAGSVGLWGSTGNRFDNFFANTL